MRYTERLPWVRLASAIIDFAKRDLIKLNSHSNEAKVFLESEWCKDLEFMIGLVRKPGREEDYQE